MSDVHHTDLRTADLATGCSCGGVSRGDETPAVQPSSDGALAGRIPTLSIERGFVACNGCFGDPAQYLADFEERCPECNGDGFVEDPDFIDGDVEPFDAQREWGTYRVINGRVA